jgi:flagellar hook-associated protein 1
VALSVGLNTVMRALLTQQQAMDITSQNVANANTEGYTRQRVHMQAVAPAGVPSVGGGVDVQGIERIRDQFLDFQIRMESGSEGEYRMRSESLAMAEISLNEPSEGGLLQLMDAFFNAWRDLANAPEETTARQAVIEAGSALAFAGQRANGTFTALQDDANSRISSTVDEINSLASEVARLNQQIMSQRVGGDPASELTDQRDMALDRLSQITNLQVIEKGSGETDLFIGGRALVLSNKNFELYVDPNILNNNYFDVKWTADSTVAQFSTGEMKGLLLQRDTDLPARVADLDTLIGQLIVDVNAVHAAGFASDGVTTGTAFFTGTDSSDVAVNAAVVASPALVAAAAVAAATGDNTNAHTMTGLQFALNLVGGTQTYDAFYTGMVTKLGVGARDTAALAANQQQVITRVEQLRQSVSGVNLDEEMVALVQYQRAYEAAAQIISKIDEMLDRLINGTI